MIHKSAYTALFMGLSTGALADTQPPADHGAAPLQLLFSKYDEYLDLAEKGDPGFRPLYRAISKREDTGPIQFEFTHEGQTYRMDADSEGFIDFRPTRAVFEANPTVKVNQPKGTMAMNLSVALNVPLEKDYNLKALHDQTHSVWKEVKKLGGFMSFLAPKHTNLLVVFEDACEAASWKVTTGTEVMESSGREAQIPFKDKEARKADSITFSCTPKRIVFQ